VYCSLHPKLFSLYNNELQHCHHNYDLDNDFDDDFNIYNHIHYNHDPVPYDLSPDHNNSTQRHNEILNFDVDYYYHHNHNEYNHHNSVSNDLPSNYHNIGTQRHDNHFHK